MSVRKTKQLRELVRYGRVIRDNIARCEAGSGHVAARREASRMRDVILGINTLAAECFDASSGYITNKSARRTYAQAGRDLEYYGVLLQEWLDRFESGVGFEILHTATEKPVSAVNWLNDILINLSKVVTAPPIPRPKITREEMLAAEQAEGGSVDAPMPSSDSTLNTSRPGALGDAALKSMDEIFGAQP